ncbi:DUF3794 domain-containing protein [Tepidibacillus infernus]|uniref:SipL SPOCS domain-containing protein n=1 Tax=Tepidibacillus decaturensis TaxID=1413211 RepID=A0A135L2E6_9BACI|nr:MULTISPECIES: DUF3794 domain-containing protein [Tepidibacillus]KXG43087.1 hypothetical protein U473_02880 [Tepidibacillus decaturensis]GBF10025.1 hypothetical protein HK1_00037 [Tepidibacillus sp. HK-1]
MNIFRDMINYVGIANSEDYPETPICFKQFTLNEKINVPEQKPDIEQILKVMSIVKIINKRLIKTPYNKKIIIDGVVKQIFVYTAATPEQSVHSFNNEIHFCEMIIIDNEVNEDLKQLKIKIVVEDIHVFHHDLRNIQVSKVLCAIIEFDHYLPPPHYDEEEE